jgi:GDP-4-dehydro-6-deoxy-D-mannose reductase
VRVLVTGAAGFVGGYLVRDLCADGCEVFAGALEPETAFAPGVTPVPLDVTDGGSVRRAVAEARPDAVFHLAAQASVGASFADPLGTWDVNATGTLRLVQALPRGCRLLFVSSAEVYGAVPEAEQPIAEARPPRPATPYAASKAAAEAVVLQAALSGEARAVVARSFNHTGPGQDPRFSLPSFAAQLAAMGAGDGPPVLRVGNLSARRDFLDVRDVVRAYRVLLDEGEPGGVYNVCSGRAQPVKDLVDEMVALSRTGARMEVDPERVRPVDVPLLLGDPSRVRTLGWSPRIPLRQTLADLLAWETARAAAGTEAAT